jgi:hypothetical protein
MVVLGLQLELPCYDMITISLALTRLWRHSETMAVASTVSLSQKKNYYIRYITKTRRVPVKWFFLWMLYLCGHYFKKIVMQRCDANPQRKRKSWPKLNVGCVRSGSNRRFLWGYYCMLSISPKRVSADRVLNCSSCFCPIRAYFTHSGARFIFSPSSFLKAREKNSPCCVCVSPLK